MPVADLRIRLLGMHDRPIQAVNRIAPRDQRQHRLQREDPIMPATATSSGRPALRHGIDRVFSLVGGLELVNLTDFAATVGRQGVPLREDHEDRAARLEQPVPFQEGRNRVGEMLDHMARDYVALAAVVQRDIFGLGMDVNFSDAPAQGRLTLRVEGEDGLEQEGRPGPAPISVMGCSDETRWERSQDYAGSSSFHPGRTLR